MDKIESILTLTKKALGIAEEYEQFDPDIIMHINTVFTILNQMGVGPLEGFRIEDSDSTWSEFTDDKVNMESVKSYMELKVKVMFDPSASSVITESMNRIIGELEWRLTNG